MGERVWPTVQGLSEAGKGKRKEEGNRAQRPLETRTPGPKDLTREVREEGGLQLTESAGAAH